VKRPVKVLTIMGTRPEIIKLAPVVRELGRRRDRFVSRVCATGQHREMLEKAVETFELRPDIDLGLMAHDQALGELTAGAIRCLDGVLSDESPDIVLVQGDTTTAFCGSLAAFYHRVSVGHVEAGLRTWRKYAPFPEEINRSLIGRIADFHFAPTPRARDSLLKEGVDESRIFLTGNTVIDALLWVRDRVSDGVPSGVSESVVRSIAGKTIVLVTGHRRESFGRGFENICSSIRRVAGDFADVHFVYPVHLNPNVRGPVYELLGQHPRIHLIEPLDYEAFVWLMDRASIVLTDSGGVQEEAPSLGKPVLVMRETTERPEGVAAGNALLVGTDVERIVGELGRLLRDEAARAEMARQRNPYGDGEAARRIVDVLDEHL
jgi:UDP-N-acetylglucosamine 2-epimerase